ncbi:MAG: rod shape-determining protein MreC [Armatimonadota bacterium]
MLRKSRTGLDTRPIIALIVLALVLTIWQHRARSSAAEADSNASLPERMAAALAWPMQRGFASLGNGVEGVVTGLGQYRKLAAENQRLKAEKEELAAQKLSLVEASAENQQLRKLLGLSKRLRGEPLVAQIVGMNYGLSRKRLTVLAPPQRSLEVGNIVRTHAGLVGRVTNVDGRRGQVFPLIDGEHAVACIIQRSRDQGMVRVAAQTEYQPDCLVMDKLIGRADIREGDEVLTSGMGEVYPAGIPVGTVVATRRSSAGTMDLTAVIRPKVDFDHLSYVLVTRHGN